MRDVAAKAGVSMATVSHVLNKTRHVAPETAERILEAIRELGYYQNIHAQRLAQGRSNLVGLVLSEIANPFFSDVIKGFETAALASGFEMLLCNTEYDPGKAQAAVRKLIAYNVPGVAVMTSTLDGTFFKDVVSRDVALILHNQRGVAPWTSNIRVDYSQGICQAIDHLIALGHKRFAIISGPLNIPSAIIVRDAFVEALEQRKLSPVHLVESNYKVDGGASAVRSLIVEAASPTALLCGNDLIAIGAISALEEFGIDVPAHISVVGCDDIFFARLSRPPLTTIHVPCEGLGKLAVEAVEKLLRSKRHQGKEYDVQTHLVVRRSTGPAGDARAATDRRPIPPPPAHPATPPASDCTSPER
jgi:LacI family transcriptional regulator